MIYDVHAHLDLASDLASLISNAKKKNVKIIITNSVNLKSLKKNFEIKDKYGEIIQLAAGLYPEEDLTLEKFEEFENFVRMNKKKIIAIGEIGMDKTEELDFLLQKEIFVKQLNLARELNLPVIIHTRKAEEEVLSILKDCKDLKIVLHCFSGKFKLVKKGEELGCYFSIPTNVVRSEQFQKMVEELPRNRILTETDSPYLSPFKDKENESSFIVESIKKISEIWNLSEEEVEIQIEKNYLDFFG